MNAVIHHFQKPASVKIIQIVDQHGVLFGLGDDGELYERFRGEWCFVTAPKDTSAYEPSVYSK